jgi:hypothetical protein
MNIRVMLVTAAALRKKVAHMQYQAIARKSTS